MGKVVNDFYLYVHRKETDNSIFYVGKGQGDRAWATRKRNPHWHNVAKKHGLVVEVVLDGLTESQAFKLEVELILWYGRKNIGTGSLTNIHCGGKGGAHDDPVVKLKQVEATKAALNKPGIFEKRSEASTSSWKNPDVREKRIKNASESRLRVESRIKASQSAYKSWENPEVRAARTSKIAESSLRKSNVKAVLCVETGVIFQSTGKAQEWLRVKNPKATGSNILGCCRGIYKKIYGYTWRYA